MAGPDTTGDFHVGDALDHVATLDEESVDLVPFSPPYDAVRDYNGSWTLDLPRLGSDLLRVVKDGGFAVVVMTDGTKAQHKSLTTFRTAVEWVDAGWSMFEHVIYAATAAPARGGRPGFEWTTNTF